MRIGLFQEAFGANLTKKVTDDQRDRVRVRPYEPRFAQREAEKSAKKTVDQSIECGSVLKSEPLEPPVLRRTIQRESGQFHEKV